LTFKSKLAAPAGPGKMKVTGDLTMHGVTKEVVLDVEGPTLPVKDQRGVQHIGASATTKINRQDFGLAYNRLLEGGGAVLGNEVAVILDLELTKSAALPSSK